MSDICFGLVEFNIDLSKAKDADPLTRQLVQESLLNSFFLDLSWQIQEENCRQTLDPKRKSYGLSRKNSLEFFLCDSPISGDMGLTIDNFASNYERDGNALNSNLYKFFKPLWANPAIKRMIIIFCWNYTYGDKLTEFRLNNIETMLNSFYLNYLETYAQPNAIFYLTR